MYYGRRSSLRFKEKKVYTLGLGAFEKFYIIVCTFLHYISLAVDGYTAQTFWTYRHDPGRMWMFYATAFWAGLPGLFHCIADHHTEYLRPADPSSVANDLRLVDESPPLFERRKLSRWYVRIGMYIINLFQLRCLFEAILSFKYNFMTGAYRDTRMAQAACTSVMQALTQSYILFDSGFSIESAASLVMSMVIIGIIPSDSPCCEDNRHLMRIKRELYDQDLVDTDSEIEVDEQPMIEEDEDEEYSTANLRKRL